jgi:Ca2+/Na+ antiporter
MFRKFTFIWVMIILMILGSLYVKFIYPDQSEAQETQTVDLNTAYHLPPEQIEAWLKDHSVKEVEGMVKQHIENEIKKGAEPVYGTITLNEESNKLVLEKQKSEQKEKKNVAERFFQFVLNKVFSGKEE